MDEQRNKWIAVIMLIIIFGAAILVVVMIGQNRTEIEKFISGLGVWGSIMIVVLYTVLSFSPIPADSITLINGALYGPVQGALTAWLGMLAATQVEYFVGQRIGKAADFEKKRSNLPLGLGKLPVDSVLFLLGGRMITGAGSKIVSYLSGMYQINFLRYFWTSAVATLFGPVIFALFGSGLTQII